MSSSDASDGAAETPDAAHGARGYWTAAAFSAAVIIAAAFPLARTAVLAVLTFPLRVASWALPGDSVYTDAVWAARILGWIGWALMAFVWAPVLMIIVGLTLKFVPLFHTRGAELSRAMRGRAGLAVAGVSWLAALMPAIVVGALTAFGYLLPWALGPAVLLSLALLSPALMRGDEHPVVALVRFSAARISDAIGLIGDSARWASLALVIVVAVAVTQRYVFGITFTKLDELVVYLHAAMFMLMAAATLKADGHVRVDVLYGARSRTGKALINFLGVYVLLVPMCLVILDKSPRYVGLAWFSEEGSTESDGLPLVYLLKTVIPVFATLLLAQGAALAAREALVLVGVDSGEEDEESDASLEHHEMV